MLWNNILIRFNKVCIIGSTFTAYYSGLINIQSYIDTTAETRIDVLVFAHGPLLEYASTAHGIEEALYTLK
jgi:hypothetical protein